jgi:hypothetical protein
MEVDGQMLTSPSPRPAAKKFRRLNDTPGTRLELMVVSTGAHHCVGIDLASGALVRAWSFAEVDPRLAPYDVVAVTVGGGPDLVPDPTEPDALVVAGAPVHVGQLTGRRAARLMRALLHPEKIPLLGFHGPTVPLWERTPDHPSVALAQPSSLVAVTAESGGMWCHFVWDSRPQVLACADPRLAAWMQRSGRSSATVREGTYLVVALEPPVEGICHKVVEALVPPR